MSNIIGYTKGEKCSRNGCNGIIDEHDKDGGCSCHISPPCGHCTTDTSYCPECDWSAEEEQEQYDIAYAEEHNKLAKRYEILARERQATMDLFWKKYRGELPAEELEIIHESHTHFSMKKIGVFPKGTQTRGSIEVKVKGTFGGRFESFTEFSFKYIAYTD